MAVLICLVTVIGGGYAVFRSWATNMHFENEDIDVTDRPEKREGIVPGSSYYLPDGMYVTKRQREYFLDEPIGKTQEHPPSGRPRSRMEYESSPSQWPEIISFLGPDATFRIDRVHHYISFEYSKIYVVGLVTDGDRTYSPVIWSWPKFDRPVRKDDDTPTPIKR